ncbi:beta-1,3-galactosyltransferase 5 [Galendromus occidentalis]|uniref:Hexosyltransferase n=1 Tax=Galendromus occidentalis TaxID=34638 RepID=A0AAJ6QN79_9ACAR|nr:beta-1,3-galactosyltransferase 5 [Galendromus occidentalis]
MRICGKPLRKHVPIIVSCVSLLLFVLVLTLHSSTRKVWKFGYAVTIEPDEAGATVSQKPILVCVSSASANRENRDVIRETWGSHPLLRVLFFLGVNIEHQADVIEEARKHADVVQYNFLDTYRNLTLKTASMIHWAHHNRWKQREIVLKVDDDTFLNTRVLEKHLDRFQRPAIYGSVLKDVAPVRDPTSQYYLSWAEYFFPTFPPYLSGALYVLQEGIIGTLYQNMCKLTYLAIEDVYFTGLLADFIGVERIALPQSARLLDVPEYISDRRTAWFYGEVNLDVSALLGVHYVTPELQMKYWKQIKTDP